MHQVKEEEGREGVREGGSAVYRGPQVVVMAATARKERGREGGRGGEGR